jgi:hypothetical protein
MRKLLPTTLVVFGIVLAARPTPAHADFGLGLFIGRPTGIDFKFGLGYRSAIDILLGFDTIEAGRGGYGHLTYLVTPLIGQGDAVIVPVRIGIGGALYGTSNDLDVAIRAPLEIGLRLRRAPVEFYGEVALALTLFDAGADSLQVDVQGGIGFRLYYPCAAAR